jgi:hypothetical protein
MPNDWAKSKHAFVPARFPLTLAGRFATVPVMVYKPKGRRFFIIEFHHHGQRIRKRKAD